MEESWRDTIITRLHERNCTQTTPFQHIIPAYINLQKQYRETYTQKTTLERENLVIKKTTADPLIIEELKENVNKLKAELMDSYKNKHENVSSVLILKEEKEKLGSTLDLTNRELEALRTRIEECEEDIKEKDLATKQLKSANELLFNENDDLKHKLDEQIQEVLKLKHENQQLLERMLKLKEDQITQMNELNEYYESILRREKALETFKPGPDVDLSFETSSGRELVRPVSVPVRTLHKIMGHGGEISAVSYNDGGNLIVTAGSDNFVKLWDPTKGQEKMCLRGMPRGALDASISPGTELIMAGSTDNNAYIWNYATARVKHTLTGHAGKVCSSIFFNNKLSAVTGSEDRTMRIWDVAKGYCSKTITVFSSCLGVCLSHEDSIMASAHNDGHLRIWASRTGENIQDLPLHDLPTTHTAICWNGHYAATSSKDNTISILDLRMFEKLVTLSHPDYQNSGKFSKICWSSDSRYIVAGGHNGWVFIWDINSGKADTILKNEHSNPVIAVSWKPRGSQFVSVDSVGGIVVWD
ncbi:unnamed protein product [Blepharisma stoltei]|uniref:Autophagy-related protein 16 domain-containing protein n=1 Tax=Blepharisma stoltei TaxID=1481888 RepID=A0AAU9KGU7_9CILI|nr:unnamed protein product [Blepharisma stoltei]